MLNINSKPQEASTNAANTRREAAQNDAGVSANSIDRLSFESGSPMGYIFAMDQYLKGMTLPKKDFLEKSKWMEDTGSPLSGCNYWF